MIRNIEWAILVECKKDREDKTYNRNFIFETEKQALELKEGYRFYTK